MRRDKETTASEVSQEVEKSITGADAQRAAELGRLQILRQAKARSMGREQGRLSRKLGSGHPRVLALTNKIEVNRELMRDLVIEAEHAKTEVPTVDKNTWTVHGFVRDKDRAGVRNLTVALYDDKGQWIRELGYTCTEKSGYFKLLHSRAKPGVTDVGKEGEEARREPGEKLYIHVTNPQGAHIHVDKQPLTPEPGRVDYREIILGEDEAVCRPPESGLAPQPGKDEGKERTRYLGNSSKRELHDMTKVTSRCHIDEIHSDHRVSFKTEREAIAAGYDYCAYCFGKEKSKR